MHKHAIGPMLQCQNAAIYTYMYVLHDLCGCPGGNKIRIFSKMASYSVIFESKTKFKHKYVVCIML